MEMFVNYLARKQGVHVGRRFFSTFALFVLAENISIPTVVLDFPSWKKFKKELKKGYTHVGINFIVQNIYKVKRMTEYIRKKNPNTKILLGGYGVLIPELESVIDYDDVCMGEGVSWLRKYFGEDANLPFKHPIILNSVNGRLYGTKIKSKSSIVFSGVGCEKSCSFCLSSAKYGHKYISFLPNGLDLFKICCEIEKKLGTIAITLFDDNILEKKGRIKSLLEELEKNNKHFIFFMLASADNIMNLGVDFLVRLGVVSVWFGTETRETIFPKNRGVDLHKLIEELQTKGIMVITSSILFLEHQTETSIKEDIDWVISLRSNYTLFAGYVPFFPTPLYKKLEKQGRLRHDIDYQYWLEEGKKGIFLFKNPNFPDGHKNVKIIRNAYKKKYRMHGSSNLINYETYLKGYLNAKKDYFFRKQTNLYWNHDTCKYEYSKEKKKDLYMMQNIIIRKKIAMLQYPTMLATRIFSPNRASRKKVKEVKALYIETFGKPLFRQRLKSYYILLCATKEYLRILLCKIKGHETIGYNPKTERREYHM